MAVDKKINVTSSVKKGSPVNFAGSTDKEGPSINCLSNANPPNEAGRNIQSTIRPPLSGMGDEGNGNQDFLFPARLYPQEMYRLIATVYERFSCLRSPAF